MRAAGPARFPNTDPRRGAGRIRQPDRHHDDRAVRRRRRDFPDRTGQNGQQPHPGIGRQQRTETVHPCHAGHCGHRRLYKQYGNRRADAPDRGESRSQCEHERQPRTDAAGIRKQHGRYADADRDRPEPRYPERTDRRGLPAADLLFVHSGRPGMYPDRNHRADPAEPMVPRSEKREKTATADRKIARRTGPRIPTRRQPVPGQGIRRLSGRRTNGAGTGHPTAIRPQPGRNPPNPIAPIAFPEIGQPAVGRPRYDAPRRGYPLLDGAF